MEVLGGFLYKVRNMPDLDEEANQKKIQNQNRVSSSMYTMTFSSLNRKINNKNEGVKHGSYQRYLDNKKGKQISEIVRIVANEPKKGNKVKAYSISSYNYDCACEFNNDSTDDFDIDGEIVE